MHILVLSFYYPPDLGPGSLRAKSIVDALKNEGPKDLKIDIITTLPNRYKSFQILADNYEKNNDSFVYRIKIPKHKNKFIDQTKSFIFYAYKALKLINNNDYDIVVATSSRLMTAVLGASISKRKNSKLYLDIRDIFSDTISSIFNNKFFKPVIPLINFLERRTFNYADKINIVSEGFLNHFKVRYPYKSVSVYTNGIDDFFLKNEFINNSNNKKIKILYAGNIGDGQGLHKIIPFIAKRLNDVEFKIIGDGSAVRTLIDKVEFYNLNNIQILKPISRKKLIIEYREADILLIHLNNYSALEKVLPSKVFEYASTSKPILAGVAGYAREFLEKQVRGVEVFNPCDVNAMESSFIKLLKKPKFIDRSDFCKSYRRIDIMEKLAKDILQMK